MKFKYCYIVVYSLPNGDGQIEVFRNTKVKTLSEFHTLQEYVRKTLKEKHGFGQVFIKNLIELKNDAS